MKVYEFFDATTDEELGRFVRMYMTGYTYEAIGESFAISTSMAKMVKRAIRHSAVTVDASSSAKERERLRRIAERKQHLLARKEMLRILIFSLKSYGLSYAEIGSKLGVSRQRVQQFAAPTKEERRELLERAGNRCEDCGISEVKLDAHHIDYETNEVRIFCVSCLELPSTPG